MIQIFKDPSNNNPYTSTSIIVNSLNEAAKRLGLYSEEGKKIVYDCLGNQHGLNPDAIICVFEMLFPQIILQNLGGKPTLGVSRDNLKFLLEAGYPKELSNYFCLGVDSDKYKYVYKGSNEKFRFLTYTESNTRGCLERVVQAFCQEFQGQDNIELYIKDRHATDLFRMWVNEAAIEWKVNIIYDDEECQDVNKLLELASTVDAAIQLNRSSTWDMKCLEVLSMGIPTISNVYSGHREYIIDGFSGLQVQSMIKPFTNQDIAYLTDLGLKNYLLDRSFYSYPPYWDSIEFGDLKYQMRHLYENKELRQRLSYGARTTAEKFTWERSIVNLVQCLREFNLC